MTTIPLLASHNCYPCCWFAKEKRCHCTCDGTNHGRLNPLGPKDIRQQFNLSGRDYQTTLFPLPNSRSQILQTPSDPAQPRTATPKITECSSCHIPVVSTVNTRPNLCPACSTRRASHRRFVLAKAGRSIRPLPGLNAQPSQQAFNIEHHLKPNAPWYLLP